MKRLIILSTIVFLAVIGISAHLSNDALVQAFAGNSVLLQGVRAGIIALLVSFLFIEPPRSILFRAFLAVASVGLFVGVSTLLLDNYMAPLDAVMFVEVAIIFAIEALEMPFVTRAATNKAPVLKV